MQRRNVPPTAARSEAPVTQKLPYAPPKATFVPLKLEERLLQCNKTGSCASDNQLS
jgi:hypothetical protein